MLGGFFFSSIIGIFSVGRVPPFTWDLFFFRVAPGGVDRQDAPLIRPFFLLPDSPLFLPLPPFHFPPPPPGTSPPSLSWRSPLYPFRSSVFLHELDSSTLPGPFVFIARRGAPPQVKFALPSSAPALFFSPSTNERSFSFRGRSEPFSSSVAPFLSFFLRPSFFFFTAGNFLCSMQKPPPRQLPHPCYTPALFLPSVNGRLPLGIILFFREGSSPPFPFKLFLFGLFLGVFPLLFSEKHFSALLFQPSSWYEQSRALIFLIARGFIPLVGRQARARRTRRRSSLLFLSPSGFFLLSSPAISRNCFFFSPRQKLFVLSATCLFFFPISANSFPKTSFP